MEHTLAKEENPTENSIDTFLDQATLDTEILLRGTVEKLYAACGPNDTSEENDKRVERYDPRYGSRSIDFSDWKDNFDHFRIIGTRVESPPTQTLLTEKVDAMNQQFQDQLLIQVLKQDIAPTIRALMDEIIRLIHRHKQVESKRSEHRHQRQYVLASVHKHPCRFRNIDQLQPILLKKTQMTSKENTAAPNSPKYRPYEMSFPAERTKSRAKSSRPSTSNYGLMDRERPLFTDCFVKKGQIESQDE